MNCIKREPITKTVERIKTGELSIVALVKEHIALAKKTQQELNAFITILEDEAIQKAEELEHELRQNPEAFAQKKLLGIPFTAKDLYLVQGVRTTFGSKLMEDFVAPYTGTVIQKCFDEGAILIGKANCDPWGFGGSGENSGYGAAKNPYDETRSPGGSSSGSAASMAAGVGFFSLGTDTGGSVRQPAAMCGLYGYKPTYGRNSRYGIGVMGSSFDTPGFFARHLEDVALLEEIMQGRDRFDATTDDYSLHLASKNVNNLSPSPKQQENVKRKFGLVKEFFEGLGEEMNQVIMRYVDDLKKAGHEIIEVSIPSTKYSLPVYYILVPAEISANRARYDGVRYGKKVSDDYEENLIESRSRYFEAEVKRRIMIGTYVLSAGYADQYYKNASKVRTKLKNEYKKVFESVDLLLVPTSPTTAFKLGEKLDDPVAMYLSDIYTVTANLVGIPAINIPIGTDSQGLPIGAQLMAPWWKDFELLGV